MKKKIPLTLLLCVVFTFWGWSQENKYLLIDKYTKKRYYYYNGSPIWFKIKEESMIFEFKGHIRNFSSDGLHLAEINNMDFPIEKIEVVYHYNKKIDVASRFTMYMSVAPLILVTLPELIQYKKLNMGGVGLFALIFGVGSSLKLFKWKALKRKRYRMRIMNSNMTIFIK